MPTDSVIRKSCVLLERAIHKAAMAWFDDRKTPKVKLIAGRVSKVPEGLWVKCTKCAEIIQSKILADNAHVCQECGHHFRLKSADRVALLCDEGAFQEFDAHLESNDPLVFLDIKPYSVRLTAACGKTGQKDAFVVGKAAIKSLPYYLGVFEFQFMGGSMGAVVGEKVARLFEHALADKLPAVIVCASGGARMQEGIVSLMQMAKTSMLIEKMREAGLPYIVILTDPTTGGVAASFAMLGDVILAEPGALIGFAGPRVIAQTIRQALPEGFQRSEFLQKRGFVDRIVRRGDLAHELRQLMVHLGRKTCAFGVS